MPYIYLYLPLLLGRWVRFKIQHSQFIFFPVFYGTVFVDLAFLSMPSSQKSANKSSSQLSHQISVRSTDQAPAMSNVGVGISKQPLSNLYNKLPSADMKNCTNWKKWGSKNTGLREIFPEYDWVVFDPKKKTANHQAQLNKTCEVEQNLLGGFNSKWESSPNRGENKKCLKPPPRKRRVT